MEALTDEQFSELFSTIMALHTQERNRLFFVASSSSSGTMHPHYARPGRYAELPDAANAAAAQSSARYSAPVGVVYQYLNMRNARAVIGFEPERTYV